MNENGKYFNLVNLNTGGLWLDKLGFLTAIYPVTFMPRFLFGIEMESCSQSK